jgi:hypothetical protein
MTAVGSDDEARAKDVLLARRSGGTDSDDAISLSHKGGHPCLIKDVNARGRCCILQETVEPLPTGTVLSSVTGKPDVDKGIVLSQSDDVRRRCHRADCIADTHVVENVETWRVNRMSRKDLIARKSILIEE